MNHMNDIEILGRLHQLRNHCDCANDLLTNGRRSGQDVISAESARGTSERGGAGADFGVWADAAAEGDEDLGKL